MDKKKITKKLSTGKKSEDEPNLTEPETTSCDELDDAKKQSVLKMIEIRLKGISEATNRAKIAFIITTIASCAMLITVFNAYSSFTRQRAFERTLKFQAVNLRDPAKFFECLKNKDDKACQRSKGSHRFVKMIVGNYKLPNEDPLSNIDKEKFKDRIEELEARRKILLKPFFDRINNEILEDMNLYRFGSTKMPPNNEVAFNELFRERKNEGKFDDPDKGHYNEPITNIKEVIQYKIYHPNTLDFYKPAVNNVNKAILERLFPQLEWNTTFAEKNIPYSIYEQNKRAISEEWIENQNIRISLLGVNVNVDQFSLLGSATLMIISFWMLFSQRRENRAIVTLLRDVKEEVKRPKYGKNEKHSKNEQQDDCWDIANLAFHGIVHNMIFAQTGRDDRPMSTQNIIPGEELKFRWRIINLLTAVLTRTIRFVVGGLFFLPVGTIITILIVDGMTTTEILYPFFNNPAEALIQRNISFPSIISRELIFGGIFGVCTALSCVACLIFQIQTTWALREFDEGLRSRRILRYRQESKLLTRVVLRPIKNRLRQRKRLREERRLQKG